MFNKSALVIGAGPVGLASAKCCLQEGFQQCDKLGGVWNYEEGSVEQLKQSAYESLTTNSARYLNSFSDFLPQPGRSHASHYEIIQYLSDYAKQFNLFDIIKYRHKVSDITPCFPSDEPLYPCSWQVTYQSPSGSYKQVFDCVLVCTGQYWRPKSIYFPGRELFSGPYFHSHYYRKPSQLEEKGAIKNVLLIGVGNSAFDIALELASCGKNVIMSSRSGTRIMSSQTDKNTPTDEFLWRRYWQMDKEKNKKIIQEFNSFSIPLQTACEEAGLLKPHRDPIRSHFSIIKQPQALLSFLKSKRISFKPNVSSIETNQVRFEDGSSARVDCIIECVGYDLAFPFLEKKDLFPGIIGERLDLYKNVMHPQYPNLCIMAQVDVLGSMFAVGEMQARWVAGVLRGRIPLAQLHQREEWVRNFIQKILKTKPKFTSFLHYYTYMESFAKEIGCMPILDESQEEYDLLMQQTTYPFHYRIDGYQKWEKAREMLKAKL